MVIYTQEETVIRTILSLQPKNNERTAVIEYFLEKQVLEQSSKTLGFIAAELYTPIDSGPLLVTATWQDVDSYSRWVNDPWRAKSSETLSSLLDQEINSKTTGSIFQLVHAVSL
jgi:quinol monooxygenase YgiN